MKVSIDRIEGGFAVVETEERKLVNLPLSLVPPGASEGSILSIELDGAETKRRQNVTASLIAELWKD